VNLLPGLRVWRVKFQCAWVGKDNASRVNLLPELRVWPVKGDVIERY
jgi:hypothetical protein